MRWIIVFGLICIVAIFGIMGLLWAFGWADALGLNGHGIAALALGTVFTVGLGVGLMALVFHSSRSGRDEDFTISVGDKPRE